MNRFFSAVVAPILGIALAGCSAASVATPLPDPAVDIPLARAAGVQTAVLAGGCFWGVEGVFEHVKGVTRVVSGYSDGAAETGTYPQVSTGRTGHAESVQIFYDPARISYGQLLKVFFAVAHDPTELNRQGPDTGTQYRSVIFYANPDQKRVADDYIAQLQKAHVYPRPIVTQVVPLKAFYNAEAYHQHYLDRHPNQPYIVINDLPKIANLKREYPSLYVTK
ncbi:MAG TPA: peptide-methionine (S)-S-oxide reductase MsrA [Sulfuriferula sp.]|nr:peptide-methionine (S)-S-oxide reductase MsrA [Sulfuriferula sp.]